MTKRTWVAKRVLKRCIDRDIPLAQLAREAGMTRQGMAGVIDGQSANPRLRILICERLGFEPEELGWPSMETLKEQLEGGKQKRAGGG